MKVCGFSFIRNAITFDYPIREAILSILPLCDKVYVAVGDSDDNTRELVSSISDKIVVIDTVWDDTLRAGGHVLAEETNKALQSIPEKYHWCFYIQGDEIIHEKDYNSVRNAMETWLDDPKVEGLLFNYLHFYGSYDYLATSGRWYANEIRVIKNDKHIFSYGDAMGFRIKPNRKLQVKQVDATIYHYGWVKHPTKQQDKQKEFHKLWTKDEDLSQKVDNSIDNFDYSKIDQLKLFTGDHPKVMQERINHQNWKFDYDPTIDRRSLKEKIRSQIKKLTGWRPGEYKNYKLLK